MHCHHPKQPANQQERFSYDRQCFHVQTPASKLFFRAVHKHLCRCTCRLDTCQRTAETLNSHQFMTCLMVGLSLQPRESLFYTLYSHREAYTGDGHCTVHGVCSIALAKSSYSSTLYIWIKAPYSTRNTARLSNT